MDRPPLPRTPAARSEATGLADLLERVLDKGVVIAGDIRIDVAQVELLTIRLRLLIASVDTAKSMGIDWWERDRFLRGEEADRPELGPAGAEADPAGLLERLERLEARLGQEDLGDGDDRGGDRGGG